MFNVQFSMRKPRLFVSFLFLVTGASAQTVTQRLQKAFLQFENDSQLKHAISSLYVIDAKTGQVVFDRNSQKGLAPASTQKIITSVTAFELLGKEFRYATEFGILEQKNEAGIYIKPSGDPTFGSWRWTSTNEKGIMDGIVRGIATVSKPVHSTVMIDLAGWSTQQIPDGWIWQDIANYYGAGAGALNWRENQFTIKLKSGKKIGDKVDIVATEPSLYDYTLVSEAVAAKAGSGDNAYIYFPVTGKQCIVRGTIPVNEDSFTISGAMPDPPSQFLQRLGENGFDAKAANLSWGRFNQHPETTPTIFYTHYSPSLDSIIYWFNKKSINLYGEALVKTFAFEKLGYGSTDSGVAIVRKFWKEKGLDEDELNIYDGSGLSPLNRVTTHAQVEILKYAKTKDWFPYFLQSLPEYNGMTMKSGTISDVKGFCGYHKSKDGREYIFSFLVNNYNGKTSPLVGKMFTVLNVLK